ncbi:DNA-directed RNA polymerase subunit omega [Buchananella hordeovulneris]|uniref:DNA-directed RNA polymerase subunit omega n=1 Tax=Buchananella hordeovulneris TaxID=52770 RepID=A0A1Q5PY29_9ACTO|nr:DNA-directed RNA polymerase subunit omega [Buchananella hordeovulneris]RRD45387.1 DNA-directed RNA polymerase subunit omega [Buchananella hordeovulneris]RRD53854.1 DNA-directed RNA polymerase subunit omega [Buchananella hordeovulneris]
MSASSAAQRGIIDPPIDELLTKVDSKYALVTYASRRARQINTYHQQLEQGMFEMVGPLVEHDAEDKALSIALREINEGLLRVTERREPAPMPMPTIPDFSSITVPEFDRAPEATFGDAEADFGADS